MYVYNYMWVLFSYVEFYTDETLICDRCVVKCALQVYEDMGD